MGPAKPENAREAWGSPPASEGSPAGVFVVAFSAMEHRMAEELRRADCINETCPWSGKPVSADALMIYQGNVVGFCNPGCRDKFPKAIGLFDGIASQGPSEAT